MVWAQKVWADAVDMRPCRVSTSLTIYTEDVVAQWYKCSRSGPGLIASTPVTGVRLIVAELKHVKQAELGQAALSPKLYRTFQHLCPCNPLVQVLALRPDAVNMQYNKPMALLKTLQPLCKCRADDS